MIDVRGVDFVRVPAKDIEESKDFYGRILGLADGPSRHEDWVEYQAGNLTLAVMTPDTHGDEFEPLPHGVIALGVPDVAEAKAKLEAAGVEFLGEPGDSGVCHGAAFRDPEGNGLALHHRYEPYLDGTTP